MAEVFHQGRDVMMVTSGAVAFGKQLLRSQVVMSQTVAQTFTDRARMARRRPEWGWAVGADAPPRRLGRLAGRPRR